MKTYEIWLNGCDDSTRIVRTLTEEQAKFLIEIAYATCDASSYSCQPTMLVEELEE